MSKTAFEIRTQGVFFGVKVNLSYKEFRSIKRRLSITSDQLLRRLMPMFKKRLEKRIPKLIDQLQNGVQGLIGTREFEMIAQNGHKPHKHIPDPLTRIVEHGTIYRVTRKKSSFDMEIRPKRNRIALINYHHKMRRTPRVFNEGYMYGSRSKNRGVLQGLDDTCLPFYKNGHHGKIVQKWLENSQIGMAYAIDAFLKGIDDDLRKDVAD